MLIFWSLVRNSVVLAVYLLFSVACFFTVHEHYDKDSYEGSAAGMEVIMRIMDIVGVSHLEDMKGKYVRVATKKWGDTVKIIGNIIKDRWFDYQSFYADKKEESK